MSETPRVEKPKVGTRHAVIKAAAREASRLTGIPVKEIERTMLAIASEDAPQSDKTH